MKKELVVTRAAGTGAVRDSPINGTRWSRSSRSHRTPARTAAAALAATVISPCPAAAPPPPADRPASPLALLWPGRRPAASSPARRTEPSWCRGRCRPARRSGWRRPAPCPCSNGDGDDSCSSSGQVADAFLHAHALTFLQSINWFCLLGLARVGEGMEGTRPDLYTAEPRGSFGHGGLLRSRIYMYTAAREK